MSTQKKFLLSDSDLPKQWYNIAADSPVPPTPVLNSTNFGTGDA